jgi:hypothetical protein
MRACFSKSWALAPAAATTTTTTRVEEVGEEVVAEAARMVGEVERTVEEEVAAVTVEAAVEEEAARTVVDVEEEVDVAAEAVMEAEEVVMARVAVRRRRRGARPQPRSRRKGTVESIFAVPCPSPLFPPSSGGAGKRGGTFRLWSRSDVVFIRHVFEILGYSTLSV